MQNKFPPQAANDPTRLPVAAASVDAKAGAAAASHRIPKPDLVELLRQSGYRPSLLERIAGALASPRFLQFYLGFYAGCIATVALAFIWDRFR